MYPQIPVLSFISSALTLVPLIWYLRARNIAAVAIGVWLSVTNLTFAVDALVWADTTDIKAAVWCDISTAFVTCSRIGLPAACFSICVHLERLASFSQMSTPRVRPRRIIFECLMCLGLPVVYTLLHLIVQPHRFDLFYGFGCRPATYPTVTTIFLVMIPPLLLTGATIVCAGLAWRHFLVHGVQFYGKRGSISSPTRNSYLRLVGMALLEAVLSAVLIAVIMWGVLSPGLSPIGDMSRHLDDVFVWSSEMISGNMQTVLEIEWSVTVVQSIMFFGLFACRTEVLLQGWELLHLLLGLLKRPNRSAMSNQNTLEQPYTSASVPTLPVTVVDLSLVTQTASTLAPYNRSADKSLPSIPDTSHPPSSPEDGVAISAMNVPESPTVGSAIASSHTSLASSFDPGQFVFSPNAWPQTPTTIPVRYSRCTSHASLGDVKPWSTADVWMGMLRRGVEKRYGICVTVVEERQCC